MATGLREMVDAAESWVRQACSKEEVCLIQVIHGAIILHSPHLKVKSTCVCFIAECISPY